MGVKVSHRAGMVGAVVLVVASWSAPPVAQAAAEAPDPVTAVFAPATVAAAVGAQRVAVLQLTNPGPQAILDIDVEWAGDDGITVEPDADLPTELAPGASTAVPVTVTRSADAPATASMQALVSFVDGPAGTGPRRTLVAALEVTTEQTLEAPAPIAVTAFAGTSDLIQYQSTDVFFTVANSSGVDQELESVVVSYPSFLTLAYQPPDGEQVVDDDGDATEGRGKGDGELVIPGGPQVLGAGDSAVVHLRLTAEGPLQPGTAIVLLTVDAVDTRAGTEVTVVQSQSMTFSVLGESGVLKVLGVPSLLFVPGLIFALVLWALWRFVVPGGSSAKPLALTGDSSIVVWAFALPATLLFPFLYPWVTDWFGPSRDYKTSYGLDDILYVWIMAAAAALVVWGVYVLVRALFVPQPGQSPLRVLSTFAWRPVWGRSLERPGGVRGQQALVVLRRAGDKALVSPLIWYEPGEQPADDVAGLPQKIRDRPFAAWRTLRKHEASLEVGYNPNGGDTGVTSPAWVDAADLRLTGPRYVVERGTP